MKFKSCELEILRQPRSRVMEHQALRDWILQPTLMSPSALSQDKRP